jgi:RecJ-like exonuclease
MADKTKDEKRNTSENACYMCDGRGKIEILVIELLYNSDASTDEVMTVDCPLCGGSGVLK